MFRQVDTRVIICKPTRGTRKANLIFKQKNTRELRVVDPFLYSIVPEFSKSDSDFILAEFMPNFQT